MKTKQIIIIFILFTLSISSFSQSNWNYQTGYISINNPTTSKLGLGTTPTNILDVVTGTSSNYGDYALFRTSGAVGFQGGLLVSNSASSTSGNNSFRITSSYNGSLNAYTKAKFGFVYNSAPETWLNTGNVPSLEFVAVNGNVNIAQGIGNVGIGTATPTNKLHIVTAGAFGNYALFQTVSNTYNSQGGILVTNSVATSSGNTSLKITSSYNGTLDYYTKANIGFVQNSATETWLNSGPAIQLAAYTGNIFLAAYGAGNIGMGTTAPVSKLGIAGNASIGATYGAYAAPTSGLIVEGNVGVGVVTPLEKFDVRGTGRFGDAAGNNYINIKFDGSNSTINSFGSGSLLLNWYSGKNIIVGGGGGSLPSTGTFETRYDASLASVSGKVGIGTTSPTQKLQVDGGNILIHGVDNFNASGNEAFMYIGATTYNIKSKYGTGLSFSVHSVADALFIQEGTGNVGVGTNLTSNVGGYKLIVAGKLAANEFVATLDPSWPDFVFAKEYDLMPLNELESFLCKNKHLPNVPSANEVKQNGIKLGEMNATLLQKVEELTLYIIDQNKKIESLQKEVEVLKNK